MQPLQKFELNPVCLIAYLAKVQTGSRRRFCIPCKIMNRIADKVLHTLHFYALNLGNILPPLQKSKQNLRHSFATPAKL